MTFILWQNVISIHQSAFISALSERYPVTLVVEREIEEERQKHGWNVPNMGKCTIIVAPSDEHILQLLHENHDGIHFFAGIAAFPMVSRAFTIAAKLKLKILVYAEPYNFLGLKGWLRKWKYKLYLTRYGKLIGGLLPTGELGCRCYQQAGFPPEKIFQWGYFTEQSDIVPFIETDATLPSVLFVGSIDERKNILYLADVCKKLNNHFDHFSIVGTGHLEESLKQSIQDVKYIHYLGGCSNVAVKELMYQHDLLVLPSIFDGWGAVVNEALHCGMQVIVSDHCGASILLDGKQRGEAFSFKGNNNLEVVLNRWLAKKKHTIIERQVIMNWTKEHISGQVVADYFVRICTYLYDHVDERPIAPWIK